VLVIAALKNVGLYKWY